MTYNVWLSLVVQIKACLTRSSRDSTRHGNSGLWQMTSTHSTPNGFTGIGLALPSKPIAVPDLQWNRSLVRSSPDSLCQASQQFNSNTTYMTTNVQSCILTPMHTCVTQGLNTRRLSLSRY